MTDTQASVGELISTQRQARGMTLQRLAELAGCTRSYLSLVENGHRAPPGPEMLERLEQALGMHAGTLRRAAQWEATPPDVRRRLQHLEHRQRAAQRLAEILAASGGITGAGALDDAHRSGELRQLIDALGNEAVAPAPVSDASSPAHSARAHPAAAPHAAPYEVPLINNVAAGYPREFTDLGYPARIADEYVRCPGLTDPDAFACRVVGDSMLPEYREGDIVVFSPARPIKSGMDCFARIEPDHESTFKRVYFETGPGETELIRLQPLNSAYPPRVLPREEVAGLYAAVSVTRELGGE